jgi:hypothetical protein
VTFPSEFSVAKSHCWLKNLAGEILKPPCVAAMLVSSVFCSSDLRTMEIYSELLS